MEQTASLSKILNIREKEKKDAQLEHHQSMEYFEKIAKRLYTLLSRKEEAEESKHQTLRKPTSIDKIREQTAYIEILNKQIIALQEEVNTARKVMEDKQLQLTDAHVEVKKFEKIIEFRKHEQLLVAHRAEQIMMDEISTQQYLSRKLGD
jgi:flagellar FliJ protein